MLRSREDFETVCCWDPAIRAATSDMERFVLTREMDALQFRENDAPQVFVLRAIENDHAIDHLLSVDNLLVQRKVAFMMSVKLVKSLRHETGGRYDWRPAAVAENKGAAIPLSRMPFLISRDELNANFDAATILEIGEVARSRAFLPRSIVAGFVLPPSSARLLRVVRDLYAERVQSLTGAPPSGSSGSTGASTEPGPSDEPGPAAAPETPAESETAAE